MSFSLAILLSEEHFPLKDMIVTTTIVTAIFTIFFQVSKVLRDSSAYDQAQQLAPSDADKSCVLTAMGMIGYALNDIDGAKEMLFKR